MKKWHFCCQKKKQFVFAKKYSVSEGVDLAWTHTYSWICIFKSIIVGQFVILALQINAIDIKILICKFLLYEYANATHTKKNVVLVMESRPKLKR